MMFILILYHHTAGLIKLHYVVKLELFICLKKIWKTLLRLKS